MFSYNNTEFYNVAKIILQLFNPCDKMHWDEQALKAYVTLIYLKYIYIVQFSGILVLSVVPIQFSIATYTIFVALNIYMVCMMGTDTL